MIRLLSLLTVGLLLSACATDNMPTDSRSLMSYNYTAVDKLMAQSTGKNITKATPMLVGTIGDVNNVESSSTLGRAITEQISARLAQKGYKVAELKLRQGISIQQGGSYNPGASGEYLLSRDVRDISGEHKAAAAITGTYSVGVNKVLINLRLIDIRSGNVITAYDYVLPKTVDIRAMTSNSTSGATGKGDFFNMTPWIE